MPPLPPKLRAGLRLVRLALAFSPIADVLAGAALASRLGAMPLGRVAAVAAASLCLYLGGMSLNAIVDLEVDRREAPRRPLPAGDLSVETAWLLVAIFWSLALGIAALVSATTLVHVTAMLALILGYHYPFKAHDTLGPVALGLVRALNLLLGAAACGPLTPLARTLGPAALYGAYVFGVSLVARMEDGPFHAARFRAGLGLALAVLGLFAAVHGPSATPLFLLAALPVAASFALIAVLKALPIARAAGPRGEVRRLVIFLLSGFYVFDALAALGAGKLVVALAIGALFPLSRALVRQFPPS